MDLSGRILKMLYLFHQGQIREYLRSATQQLDLTGLRGITVCTAPGFKQELLTSFNPQLAIIKAQKCYAARQSPC